MRPWQPVRALRGEASPFPTSDADGWTAFRRADHDLLLEAESAGLVCAVAGSWDAERPEHAPYVALAPAGGWRGSVRTADGDPVTDVTAWVTLDESVAVRFEGSFRGQHPLHWTAPIDAEGRVAFECVPLVPEARLTLSRADVAVATFPLLEAPVEIVLGSKCEVTLLGRVVDDAGRPKGDALVASGGAAVRTSSEGRFQLDLEEFDREDARLELWLVAAGWEPTYHRHEGAEPDHQERIDVGDVALGAVAGSIEVRLEHASGAPAAGFEVWIHDPITPGGELGNVALESLAAGGDGFHHSAMTDSAGRAELGGLRTGRLYSIRVLDPETAAWETFGPYTANMRARLVLDSDRLLGRYEGRIVADDDRPLVGAQVSVQGPGHGVGDSFVFAHGARTVTDDQGRFELKDVPRHGGWLRVEHPDTLRRTTPIESRLVEPTWRVARTAQLRVEVAAPGSEASIELFDAQGEALSMWVPTGLGEREQAHVALVGGRTPVLDVPCDAVRLVLERAGRPPRAVPLELVPGELNRLDL